MTKQGVSEGGPEAFPPGNLNVKRNVITLLESPQRNVVKRIGGLDEIGLLTERKSDPQITLKNRQAVVRIVFQCEDC